jgi:acetoin utilization deacetylase AcuC-like enzyme
MKKTYIVTDPISLKHLTGWGHPESPERYAAIVQAFSKLGLLTEGTLLHPQSCTLEDLLLCHSSEYIETVQDDFNKMNALGVTDGQFSLSTGDVQISPDSWEAALMAVGSALTAVDAVMEKRADNVFSLMRPPGHHACKDRGMGFCIFNNIAIGARYAQKKYKIKKVLIADWDVHHGNGTQDIFDADPSVFYFSTHQKGIYPGTGFAEERGIGPGLGTKLNIPIEGGPSSRIQVLEAYRDRLSMEMEKFKPDLIMISAGFDGHFADPLGGFNLTENDFAELTHSITQIADKFAKGRVISILEGGYDLIALGNSAAAHVTALRN